MPLDPADLRSCPALLRVEFPVDRLVSSVSCGICVIVGYCSVKDTYLHAALSFVFRGHARKPHWPDDVPVFSEENRPPNYLKPPRLPCQGLLWCPLTRHVANGVTSRSGYLSTAFLAKFSAFSLDSKPCIMASIASQSFSYPPRDSFLPSADEQNCHNRVCPQIP